MKAKIQRWGNSLALRIPKSVAALSSLKENSEVDLGISKNKLVIRAVKPKKDVRKRYKLSELLRKLRPENLREEIETGRPVGKEIW